MRFRTHALLLLALAGCGVSDDPNDAVGAQTNGQAPAQSAQPAAPAPQPTQSGSTPAIAAVSSAGGVQEVKPTSTVTMPAADAGSPASASTPGLPCAVQRVLQEKCQTCHSDPVVGGAAMPLITRDHFLRMSSIMPGQKVAARVKARISDSQKPMPPMGRPALNASEKQLLAKYIDDGTPASSEECGPRVDAGVAAPQPAPADMSECEVVMNLVAHGGQTAKDTSPFMAPPGTDHYQTFYYAPTWNQKMHVIRVDPIVDNPAVLHHFLLYMKEQSTEADGSHRAGGGLQSADTQLLMGWAPGNKGVPLGNDIGMQVIQGSAARFGVEIHYNSTSNPPNRADRSGARLCLTSKLRPKEAGTHWLGTQLIANLFPAGGMLETPSTCTVKQVAHIIAHSPHMHKQGRYMKTIITRQSGEKVTITDQPFSFDDQQIFPIENASNEIVVGPGDTIQTTCTFDASKAFTFGPNTADEMCYNFITAWPVGSLSNGSTGIVGGKNTCIDGL